MAGNGPKTPDYPDLFTRIPSSQPVPRKAGQLTQQQLEHYFEKGYVVVEKFFNEDELEPVKDAVHGLVDNLANKLHQAGKIQNLYKEYGLFERLVYIEKEFPGAALVLHKLRDLPQAFRDLWSNERILNVMEQLLGTSDIQCCPNWNLRCKVPQNDGHTVPWHQDAGYMEESTYGTIVPTAWIPLLDTDANNGCMQMVSGAHLKGKVAKHVCCWRDTHYLILEENEMESTLGVNIEKDVTTLPVPYGGVIFFHNITPHRSLNNCSDKIRWSMDLRWQKASDPVAYRNLKKSVQLRSSIDTDMKIDWRNYDEMFGSNEGAKSSSRSQRLCDLTHFQTTAPGSYMKQWPITHHNRHTEAWEMEQQEKKA